MGFRNFDSDEERSWTRTIRSMMDEMLQRQLVGFRGSMTWGPALNVYETAGAFVVCAELSGMTPQEIDVQCLSEMRLSIAGRRPHPRRSQPDEELSIHILEIEEGPFHREIDLPEPINTAAVSAKYEDGFLWIILPKRGAPR